MQPALTIPIAAALPDEERARSDLYGLLARLWQRAPDAALLQGLARQAAPQAAPGAARAADARQALLDEAWQALCEAAGHVTAGLAADEYDAAFGGVGRPEIFLHGSWHLAGFLHERPLAQLRAHLAALGLARSAERAETEDHVALLCETMRYLIRSPDPALSSTDTQRAFFHAHLSSWADALVDAVLASGSTHFYRHVARLMRAFFEVERAAFDLA